MRNQIIAAVFALTFIFIAGSALACPELSGNYYSQNTSGRTVISLKQTGCTELDVTVTFTAAGGVPSVSHFTFAADGVLRKVGSYNGVDQYVALKFENDHANQLTIHVQNGMPYPVLSSVTDEYSVDEAGDLVENTTAVDVLGNVRPATLKYVRGDELNGP